jgi:hypothetical protein
VKPRPDSGFTAPPLPQPTNPAGDYNRQSWLERRRRNINTGLQQGAMAVSDAAMRLYDVGRNAVSGNFQPLKEQAEGAGRGLVKLAAAFDPVNSDETYTAVSAEQDPALAAIEQRRAERLRNDPYAQNSNIIKEQLAKEASAQPGMGGAITRGVSSAGAQAPLYIGASMLGGVPAAAGLAAAESDYVRPEEAALNIASATLPVKAGRALTPAVERVATQLPGRVLPAATRAAGQVGTGAATNVALALASGERDPAKLVEQGAVGGVMSGVDAMRAARAGGTEGATFVRRPSRAERYQSAIDAAPVGAAPELSTIGGNQVSTRWLNEQRGQVGQMMGLAPDQIPVVEGQPAASSQVKPADVGAAAEGEPTRPSNGQILGSGLGFLQQFFDKSPKASGASTSTRGRISETIGAAQSVAQMGSVPFVLRNVIQHASHGAQELTTQGVAGLIDKAAAKITGKREVGGFSNPLDAVKEVGQFVSDYREGIRQAREAVKRGEPLPGAKIKDLPDPETLTAVGRKLSKVLTWINEVPDAGNWNVHFQRSLRDQVRALKSSRAPSADDTLTLADKMMERAWAEADHASMRDKNFVSNSLGAIKKGLNKASSPITGTDKFGLGDFVIKYTQVPGALVKRGIEYSPLGVVEAGYHASKGDQRRAVQSLARAVVGSTSGASVGAMLAAYGILVGPEHDKGQAAQLEREEGRRGFSINMSALKRLAGGGWSDPDESGKIQAGDQLVSIDWLQPWALQASAGAEIYRSAKRGDLSLSGVAGSVADSLGEWLSVADSQTVLRNIKNAIPYRAKDDTIVDIVRKTLAPILTGAPASFVPSVARQARQITDPYVRDTRPEQAEGLGAGLEEAANKVKEAIPGLSQTLPTRPSVLTGEPKKTAIGDYSAPVRASKLISPAGFTTYEPSPIAREADRLQQAGFNVSLGMPKRQLFEPTSGLREREAQFAGDFADAAKRLIDHPRYEEASDAVKAAAINNLVKYLRDSTNREMPERTLENIIRNAARGVATRRIQ